MHRGKTFSLLGIIFTFVSVFVLAGCSNTSESSNTISSKSNQIAQTSRSSQTTPTASNSSQ